MKITIQNIGIIVDETIECNGITLITGKNGSGKSTFGKAIASFLCGIKTAPLNFDKYFYDFARTKIASALHLKKYTFTDIYRFYFSENRRQLRNLITFVNGRYRNYSKPENLFPYLRTLFNEVVENKSVLQRIISFDNELVSESDMNQLIDNLDFTIRELEQLYFDKDGFYNSYLYSHIKSQFDLSFFGQTKNINGSESKSSILIKDSRDLMFVYDSNIGGSLTNENFSNAFYIDDSTIIDKLYSQKRTSKNEQPTTYDELLIKMLEENVTPLSKTDIKQKLSSVFDIINKAYPYDFISNGTLVTTNNGINIKNEACGRKIFALIKEMLYKSLIDDKTILIFDEPDNHLHPEWQSLFAELLIEINKCTGAKIICITHSPILLLAMQVFAKNNTPIKVYFSSKNSNRTLHFEDVSENIEKAHKELSDTYINLNLFGTNRL